MCADRVYFISMEFTMIFISIIIKMIVHFYHSDITVIPTYLSYIHHSFHKSKKRERSRYRSEEIPGCFCNRYKSHSYPK